MNSVTRALRVAVGLASFTLVAVAASRRGTEPDPANRSAPTGGYALFATSALPVHHDLNATAGRKELFDECVPPDGFHVAALRTRMSVALAANPCTVGSAGAAARPKLSNALTAAPRKRRSASPTHAAMA